MFRTGSGVIRWAADAVISSKNLIRTEETSLFDWNPIEKRRDCGYRYSSVYNHCHQTTNGSATATPRCRLVYFTADTMQNTCGHYQSWTPTRPTTQTDTHNHVAMV